MSRYYDEENDRLYVKCATCGEQTESGCGCRCDEKETDNETEDETMTEVTEQQVEDALNEVGTPSERWVVLALEVRRLRAKLEESHKLRDAMIDQLAHRGTTQSYALDPRDD